MFLLLLCSFHTNYPESFPAFRRRTPGKDLSANCFQTEIKNNHTAAFVGAPPRSGTPDSTKRSFPTRLALYSG